MNKSQNLCMFVAGINFASCALGFSCGNYGLSILNAGVAFMSLALMLLPSNPK